MFYLEFTFICISGVSTEIVLVIYSITSIDVLVNTQIVSRTYICFTKEIYPKLFNNQKTVK